MLEVRHQAGLKNQGTCQGNFVYLFSKITASHYANPRYYTAFTRFDC